MISVVIPTYNASNSIETAIDSVLNQTYQNFEIIIIDDLSKDDTWNKLLKIKNKDSRIFIFQNEKNSKSAFTRNQAIDKAKGEYIALLDDDDYWDSNKLEKQLEFLESNEDIDFVGTNAFIWDRKGTYGEIRKPMYPNKNDLVKTSPFVNPSVMFRKKTIQAVGGYRVSSETVRGQDYDLFLRMYVEGMKGANLQENLTYYFKDSDYFNKISWQSRIGEAKFRYRNFKKMGVLLQNFHYVVKPIVAIFIPNKLMAWNNSKKIEKV